MACQFAKLLEPSVDAKSSRPGWETVRTWCTMRPVASRLSVSDGVHHGNEKYGGALGRIRVALRGGQGC
jgi:hypothetical protein